MRHPLSLAALFVLAAPATAHAQDTLTPEGPATVREVWNGTVLDIDLPPQVLTHWAVTVGPGGQPGPVRLRVFDQARVVASGPTESLPAEPGTYVFAVPQAIPYDTRDHGLSLDQEVGRHAILEVPASLADQGPYADTARQHAVDLYRPQVPDGAEQATPTERLDGRRLMISATLERDLDQDRLGDETQDVGDLRLLGTPVVRRLPSGRYRVEARVRNAGSTVRHLPGLLTDDTSSPCDRPRHKWAGCVGPALAPGEETVLAAEYRRRPANVTVGAEGPDTTPADNTVPLPALLTLAKAAGAAPSVRLSTVTAGTVRLVARIAGIRITRTVRFARAGRRVVRLTPRTRADRARLARALRRPGRLAATVTATMDGDRQTLNARY